MAADIESTEVLHPPRGYWLGYFAGGAAILVGCWATLAEAEAARAESAATVGNDDLQVYITGMPEGWHTWCGAENGPLVCTRQAGHAADIGHDNGSVWWPVA